MTQPPDQPQQPSNTVMAEAGPGDGQAEPAAAGMPSASGTPSPVKPEVLPQSVSGLAADPALEPSAAPDALAVQATSPTWPAAAPGGEQLGIDPAADASEAAVAGTTPGKRKV